MQTTVIKLTKVAALASLIVFAGAQQGQAGQRDLLGLLIGGGLGALVGSQFGKGSGKGMATAGGAVLGALLGSSLMGQGLFGGQPDQAAEPAYGYRPPPTYGNGFAPSYQPGYAPAYRPAYAPAYQPAYAPVATAGYRPGAYCREFETTVTINGRPQPSHGIACYRPDGTWQIVQ